MISSVVRKLLHNPQTAVPLLAGFILTTALAASIPVFSGGTLLDLLLSDLREIQREGQGYPGNYLIDADLRFGVEDDSRLRVFEAIDGGIGQGLAGDIPLPLISEGREINSRDLSLTRPDLDGSGELWRQAISLSGVEEHIELVYGRMFEDYDDGGILEIMVTESALLQGELVIAAEYSINIPGYDDPIPARIVGVFGPSDDRDPFWFRGMEHLGRKLLISESSFDELFFRDEGRNLSNAYWAYAFDYAQIDTALVTRLLDIFASHRRLASRYGSLLELSFVGEPALQQYLLRRGRFNLFLAMLILPVLILLGLYILMISRLIIDRERNEISMLQSRGASVGIIVGRYAMEYGILALLAAAAGPPLGLLICRILGSSAGFMEFVNRSQGSYALRPAAYLFSLVAAMLLLILVLIPAWRAAGTSIVELKSRRGAPASRPGWQKWFADAVLLAASLYGLVRYRIQLENLPSMSDGGALVENVDPLLFLMSTLFILSLGLMFLRIFPLLIRLVFALRRDAWAPAPYMALLGMSRPDSRTQFVMIFVLFSVAIGMFNATAARIINKNLEDDQRYRIGADLRIFPRWIDNHANADDPWADPLEILSRPRYEEPPVGDYRELPGIGNMTRVFIDDDGSVEIANQRQGDVRIMGIVPNEFGAIAWFRGDLLPAHWYHYLNILARSSNALLVSADFSDRLVPGEGISVEFADGARAEGVVYAFVSHWPSWVPDDGPLVVANFAFLRNAGGLAPYELWMSRTGSAGDTELYAAIGDEDLDIADMRNASQAVIAIRNDALVQGINGALTLSFLVSMAVCLAGFLLYLLLSLSGRRMQFGVIRAMGLGTGEVAMVPALELVILLSGTLLAGILVGSAASALFGPLLEILAGSSAIPFVVVGDARDYLRMYALGLILAVGAYFLLRYLVRRLDVSQALKLGEG
jgi:putative ABC transport system permease protein